MSWFKKSLLWLLSISLGLIAVLILLVVAGKTHNQVASIVEVLGSFESVARFIRWGALGATIMFWDSLVDYIGKVKGFDEQQIQRAKTMRWRIAAFIVAFEFIVVEAVPARLMG